MSFVSLFHFPPNTEEWRLLLPPQIVSELLSNLSVTVTSLCLSVLPQQSVSPFNPSVSLTNKPQSMQACYLKAFSARVPQLIGRDSAALSSALLRQTTRVFHLLLIVCVCRLDHFDSLLFVVVPRCISPLIHLFHSWWTWYLRSILRQFFKISSQQLLNSSKLTKFSFVCRRSNVKITVLFQVVLYWFFWNFTVPHVSVSVSTP